MEMLLALGVMGVCFLLLGAGLLFKRRRLCLRGSCGGGSSGEKHPDISCPTCEGDAERCKDADQSDKGKPGVGSKT